jgi:hypothetical protein
MSDGFARMRAIADAVLYEGYLLYPYRASSDKNRLRWQFGVLAPRAWSERPARGVVDAERVPRRGGAGARSTAARASCSPSRASSRCARRGAAASCGRPDRAGAVALPSFDEAHVREVRFEIRSRTRRAANASCASIARRRARRAAARGAGRSGARFVRESARSRGRLRLVGALRRPRDTGACACAARTRLRAAIPRRRATSRCAPRSSASPVVRGGGRRIRLARRSARVGA